MDQAKAALDTATAYRDKAQADLQQTQERAQDDKAQLAKLADTLTASQAALAAQVQQTQGQASDAQNQLAQAKDATAKLEAQRKQLEQAVAADQATQQQAAAAAEQASDAQAQADQAIKAQQAAQAKLADLQKQTSDSAAARDKAQADLQAAQKQLSDAQAQAASAMQAAAVPNLRSDFDSKAGQALSGKPGVSVAGDRLIVQNDALFAPGSTAVSTAGRQVLQPIASTLKAATASLPPDTAWLLQVGGHADKQPGRMSNLDLSATRAISVVKALEADGVAPGHLVAAGFGDTQPLDTGATPPA